jgi:hypothetical protein
MLPVVAVLACLTVAVAKIQEQPKPQVEANHFAKDGLSFDYPTGWALKDDSTVQMQVLELSRGDHIIRVRSPREWLKTPTKEAEAKKLIQDKYVNDFAEMLRQGGLNPNRSAATSEFGGGPAEGLRLRAVLDGAPGGMDAFYRVMSDRFVQLSQIGSERDMAKFASAWDLIRKSIQVEPPPSANATPTPAKKNP